MAIAKVVLEYLTLALSWPVILGLLALYFLKRHGEAVASILSRVTSVSLPGGVKLDAPEYPPELTLPSSPPAPTSGNSLDQVEKELSNFFWQGVDLNRILVRIEIEKLWFQLMQGAFALTIPVGSEEKSPSEKIHAMKDIYRINERAIADVDFIESMTKDKPRRDLMHAFNRAGFLKWYLGFLATKKPSASEGP